MSKSRKRKPRQKVSHELRSGAGFRTTLGAQAGIDLARAADETAVAVRSSRGIEMLPVPDGVATMADVMAEQRARVSDYMGVSFREVRGEGNNIRISASTGAGPRIREAIRRQLDDMVDRTIRGSDATAPARPPRPQPSVPRPKGLQPGAPASGRRAINLDEDG